MTLAVEFESRQVVTFSLGDVTFAVPVSSVQEILDHEETVRLPLGPSYALGLRNVRGRGVPVIDLRIKLGMSPTISTPDTRLLVIDVALADDSLAIGLMADRVYEVLTFGSEMVGPAPRASLGWKSDYISNVIHRDEGFVFLIDLAKLFADEEAALAATAGQSAKTVE